jgi:hypothetical protein
MARREERSEQWWALTRSSLVTVAGVTTRIATQHADPLLALEVDCHLTYQVLEVTDMAKWKISYKMVATGNVTVEADTREQAQTKAVNLPTANLIGQDLDIELTKTQLIA